MKIVFVCCLLIAVATLASAQSRLQLTRLSTFPQRTRVSNSGSYSGASDGRYTPDNSGSYNNNDGKYYPDSAGQYVHNDDKYKHIDSKYQHTSDKFGNNGGNGGSFGDNGKNGGNGGNFRDNGKNGGNGGNFGDNTNNGGNGGNNAVNNKVQTFGNGAGTGSSISGNKKPISGLSGIAPPLAGSSTGLSLGSGSRFGLVSSSGSNFGSSSTTGSSFNSGSGSTFGSGTASASGLGFGSGSGLDAGGSKHFTNSHNKYNQEKNGKYEGNHGIIRKIENVEQDGYHYLYETENGITGEEQGKLANRDTDDEAMRAYGYYTYTGPDNVVYTVKYTADENGFIPEGVHIPTPPPIPEYILRALDYQRSIGTL